MTDTQGQLAKMDSQMAAFEVRQQVNQIQYLLSTVLIEGEHYAVIPGTSKPTLMQSGAEKIGYMFHLVPHYESVKEPVEGYPGHREYTCTCSLYKNGEKIGEAIASCSTMESRYRWRDGYEDTGEPIPSDAREHKQEYRRRGYGMKKVNGNWLWVRYIERQENPDIADTWNTVLQMAQKRAYVRAIRSTTAASDIFTQDIEDVPVELVGVEDGQSQAYEVPSQPTPSDADKEELARLVESCVSAGWDRKSIRREMWKAYKLNGGIDAARAYASQVMSSQQVQDVEPADIDF